MKEMRKISVCFLISMLAVVCNIDCGCVLASGIYWHLQTVDNSGWVGQGTSLALDSNGNPHISYCDRDNENLKYAHFDGTWHIETVASDWGWYSSIALDSNNYPHIAYYATGVDLKYAYKDVSGWHIETVDSTGRVGEDSSIVLDSNDIPHISYYLVDCALKYAVGHPGNTLTITTTEDGTTTPVFGKAMFGNSG